MILNNNDLWVVLDAVEIVSSARYTVLGEVRDVPDGGATEPSAANAPGRLVSALALDLYRRLYIRPSAPQRLIPADVLAQRDLVAALSAANTGTGTWQPGWTVRRVDADGLVVVVKDGIEFWITARDLRVSERLIRPGEPCRVRVANELRHLVPGFYVGFGDADGDDDAGDRVDPVDRYYWHLTPGAAVPFLAAATALLNAAQVPFRVKVPNDPNGYYRADAGVLYLRRRDHGRIGAMITEIYSTVAPGLRAEVPLFTKRLADGLAFAEDPTSALSFGEHRCRLAAQALWQSFTAGEAGRDACAAALAFAYERDGLDPLRPYLGPGSRDDVFQSCLTGVSFTGTSSVSAKSVGTAGVRSAFPAARAPLAAAAAIGRTLCRSAYWDSEGSLCNWMGRSTAEVSQPGGPITPTAAALGPDLYGGSAGIALFLAQLCALTGDPQFRRTALGAIARSIRQLSRLPATMPASPLSFYSGHLGVAYAARRVGALTGYPGLDAQADSILDRVGEAPSAPHELDVISGNAGAIPALLSLSRSPGLDCWRELAIALGQELCEAAIHEGAACVWEPDAVSRSEMGRGPLTGLAHGAAGIGLALFELHAATGRTDFLEAARGAFAFVDSQFDPEQGNWADLRVTDESHSAATTRSFSPAWCHGAPGIALSRLRAAALDPDGSENHLAMARVAIATTLRAIERNLGDSRSDATLCHGLSGLGEVILIASQLLDERCYHDRALAIAEALIDRHAASGQWPSGLTSGAPNPSLMLGTAGIGYWLLRLQDPATVPPFLLLIPWND